MPTLRDEIGMPARGLSGPPTLGAGITSRSTPHGQRVDPKGAPAGGGITPDAKIRQKVLNGPADQRRNMRESNLAGPPGAEQAVPVRRPTPLGTPPEGAAPPRVPGQIASSMGQPGAAPPGAPTALAPPPGTSPQVAQASISAGQAAGIPPQQAVPPQGVPVAAGAPAAPVAAPAVPPGAARQEVAQGQAQQTIAAGQVPQPPVTGEGANMKPAPGLSQEQALQDADAQSTALANQGKPEPPVAKSPLGRESPIEQADAAGKLRAGQKHHLRALGLSQSGMDPITAKHFEKTAVRDMNLFGEYDGMDDPHAPAPPIRVGKHSYNPKTGQFVAPEGFVSALDRLAPAQGTQGPPSSPFNPPRRA